MSSGESSFLKEKEKIEERARPPSHHFVEIGQKTLDDAKFCELVVGEEEEKKRFRLGLKSTNTSEGFDRMKILGYKYSHPLIAVIFHRMNEEGKNINVGIFEERKRKGENEDIYFPCSHWVEVE